MPTNEPLNTYRLEWQVFAAVWIVEAPSAREAIKKVLPSLPEYEYNQIEVTVLKLAPENEAPDGSPF